MASKKATKKKTTKKTAAKKPLVKKKAAAEKTGKRRIFQASTKKVIGGSKKSGYAKDIMPNRLDAEEAAGMAVPVASEGGVQEGRLPPGRKIYGAEYKSVSAMEAQANMMKRANGEMDIIPGGLDDMTTDEQEDQISRSEKNFDPLGGDPQDTDEPGTAELIAEEKELAQPVQRSVTLHTQAATEPNGIDTYLAQRIRLTLELTDGAMAIAAIDIKESKYGVTILLPLQDEGATFIPKPGSEITVVKGERRWNCFFPGTYFEVEELGILGIVFVKAEEG